MKIVMTGGAGYVGSACLRRLVRNGHDAIAYDNMLEGNERAVPEGRLVVGDINDRAHLTNVLRETKADAVMHFAALASVPDSIGMPDRYYQTNVVGTMNVLEAMRAAGVCRIIFSSTAATYGFGQEMPLREESAQLPETPYGTTKLAGERMIHDYAQAFGMGYTHLRYFNASGADADGQYGEDRRLEGHLIPLTLLVAVGRREKLLIYGGDYETRDGSCVRDYVHTDDLAQAHELALHSLEPGTARAYNLGVGQGVTVLEVLRACERAVGRPIAHEVVGRRPGDPGVLVASANKIVKELGWKPKYPEIDQIVATAWAWHSSHPQGYAS